MIYMTQDMKNNKLFCSKLFKIGEIITKNKKIKVVFLRIFLIFKYHFKKKGGFFCTFKDKVFLKNQK